MKIICIGGGLGNQMFQYAFRLNVFRYQDVYLDITRVSYLNEHNGFELSRIFNVSEKVITKFLKFKITGPYFYIGDRDINFYRLLFYLNKRIFRIDLKHIDNYLDDNKVLLEYNFDESFLYLLKKKGKPKYFYGTFQSHKYFEDIKEEIKKVYTFPIIKEEDEKNFKVLEDIKDSESVSIHIRRGDYLKPQWDYLNICDYDYYKNALNFIKNKLENKDLKFFIFSDDIPWCKENLDFLKDFETNYVDWNKKENSYKDMQLMSECKHNIISNSTFSWWGAYLNKNPNKIVVAPKYWFKGVRTTEDRVPGDWFLV